MAVTSSSVQLSGSSSAEASHTTGNFFVPAGNNRLVVVRCAARRGTTGVTTISSVTWGGGLSFIEAVTMNRSDGTNNHHRASIYYALAGSGAASSAFTMTVTGNVNLLHVVGIQTLFDVDQTTPLGNTGTDLGSDANATVTLSSLTAGSYAVGLSASNTTGTGTWSWANVTEEPEYDNWESIATSGLLPGGAYYANASASSIAFAATRGSASSHVLVAAEFKPAPYAFPFVRRIPVQVRL